jgi:hypothetical protein
MEFYILVQDLNETAAQFAERLTAFCKHIGTEHLEIQFTTASDGRQTCNMIHSPYRIIKTRVLQD